MAELLRRGEKVPGFGHVVYHGGDPRAMLLLDLVRRAAPRSAQLAVAEAVLAEIGQKSLPEPDIDLAIATLARVAGLARCAPRRLHREARGRWPATGGHSPVAPSIRSRSRSA